MHFSLQKVLEECSTFSGKTWIWSTNFFFFWRQLIFDKDIKTIQKRKTVSGHLCAKKNTPKLLHYVQKPT